MREVLTQVGLAALISNFEEEKVRICVYCNNGTKQKFCQVTPAAKTHLWVGKKKK